MNDIVLKKIQDLFTSITLRLSQDCWALNIYEADYLSFCAYAKNTLGYDMLVDLTAVDEGVDAQCRYRVVCHFFSTTHLDYFRLVCNCMDNENPQHPSLCSLYPAANWHEREAFDMFGIYFIKHPDLKRILMWDGYPYYPLRKDFPLAGLPTELPALDVAQNTGQTVISAPMMGGPFTSKCASTLSHAEPSAKDESWTI